MTNLFAHPLGDRAELAMLEPWHAEQFLAAVAANREYLKAAIPAAHNVHTIDDARAYLQRFADGHAKDIEHLFGIWLHGELVGVVQLFNFSTTWRTCEMGVWLVPGAQGRGLVTAAGRHVIDWALGTRGMRRVQWTNNPENVRSAAVAKRLGMTREGLLRDSFGLGGQRWDNEVWSIIADDLQN
jgi:RimJ/RimL family protein N-acetyltransferase